jgi:hypothetical protein
MPQKCLTAAWDLRGTRARDGLGGFRDQGASTAPVSVPARESPYDGGAVALQGAGGPHAGRANPRDLPAMLPAVCDEPDHEQRVHPRTVQDREAERGDGLTAVGGSCRGEENPARGRRGGQQTDEVCALLGVIL